MRRPLAALLAAPLLLAAACSSSGGTTPPSTGSTSSPAAADPAAQQLAATVTKGIAGLKSAHLAIDAGSLGGTITGDVTFAEGKTTGSDLTLDQGTGDIEVITVDGTSYAKLPAAHNTSGKPWVKVSADSGNEFVRALAGTLSLTNAATSLGSVTGLLGSATTKVVKDARPVQLNGTKTEHYALTIDPAKATGDLAATLAAAGGKPLPVDLYVDGQGRPVRVKIAIPLGSQSLPLTVDVSRFDAPVTIEAPAAGDVSGD